MAIKEITILSIVSKEAAFPKFPYSAVDKEMSGVGFFCVHSFVGIPS